MKKEDLAPGEGGGLREPERYEGGYPMMLGQHVGQSISMAAPKGDFSAERIDFVLPLQVAQTPGMPTSPIPLHSGQSTSIMSPPL